jgi:hypothetical protein
MHDSHKRHAVCKAAAKVCDLHGVDCGPLLAPFEQGFFARLFGWCRNDCFAVP